MAKGGKGSTGGRRPKHSNDANRAAGTPGQRDAATVRRLKMYTKKAVRDKKGRILHEV
jgi:nuclear GTP-binding protein